MLKRVHGFGVSLKPTVFLLGAMLSISPMLAAEGHGDWPERQIDFVVPFALGGGSDTWARVLSEAAEDHLGVPLNLRYLAGTGGTRSWEYVLSQPADGYNVYLGSPTPILTSLIYEDALMDPQNLKVAASIGSFRSLIVAQHNDGPIGTWDELVAHGRGAPIIIGGTHALLAGAAHIMEQEGVQAIYLPYDSTAQALQDFTDGFITLVAVTASTALELAPDHGSVVLNTSDQALSEDLEAELGGNVPDAADLGHEGIHFDRFVGFHPDTPDAIVAEFSNRLEALLTEDDQVAEALEAVGEEVDFVGFPEANDRYAEMIDQLRPMAEWFR